MNYLLVCAAVVGVAAVMAQDPSKPPLSLVGNRFKPLNYENMTPEQKAMTDHILAGPRGSLDGPFNVLLRSPELGELTQQLGAHVRFRSSLAPKLNELAILMTARHWTAQYEWYHHKRAALQAGLDPAIVDAIAARTRPTAMQHDEQVLYDFCNELLNTKRVSDGIFQAAVRMFGEKGVVDLVGVVGYYGLVAMLLNVDRYPLPPGVQPDLKPVR